MMEHRPFPHHNPYLHNWGGEEKRRVREDPLQPCCSLLTLLVLFLVLLGVLAVSGLALYIGALRLEPVQTLLAFDGSVRMVAERFTAGLANRSGLQFYEMSKRYQTLLEAVYGKSKLGPALHDLYVTSFANGSLVIFFRIVLDRRKIPKPISSIEETLKNVILEEAASPLSILNTLKIDSKQLHIKRVIEERQEKVELKEKDVLHSSPGMKWKKKYAPPPPPPPPPRVEPTPPPPKENNTRRTLREEEAPDLNLGDDDWRPFDPPHVGVDEGRGFRGEAEAVGAIEGTSDTPLPSLPIEGEFPDIVTLLPVRSNLGLRATLRPKPPSRAQIDQPRIPLQSYFPDDFVTEGLREVAIVTTSSDPNGNPAPRSSNHNIKFRQPKTLGFPGAQNITGKIEDQMRLLIEEIFFNISSPAPNQAPTTLSPVSVKEMAEGLDKLAKLKVSQKAVTSSHHNNAPFKLLTKVFNKASQSSNVTKATSTTEGYGCGEKAMLCGSGECIPLQLRCNRLADCRDSSDEKNCTCAQLLKSQFQSSKICDGINDCADLSDERDCEWCKSDQYQCSNAKLCIDIDKVCDGISHCPKADDENNCIYLKNRNESTVKNSGYLLARKDGVWGKVCIHNSSNAVGNKIRKERNLEDIGKAVCSILTFNNFVSIRSIEDENDNNTIYYEIDEESYVNRTHKERSSKLSFTRTTCPGREVAFVECKNLKCGLRLEVPESVTKSERRSRIVGGDNAGPGAWPWQAALYKEGEFQCGATLVSSKWLVSAAHCFYRAENEYWVARLGALRRDGPPSLYEQSQRVSNVILHPSYQDAGYLHDICLLQLEKPLIMTPHVRPICLPSSDVQLNTGRMCTVVGWGQLSEAGRLFPDTLQEVQVPIISTEECRKRTGGLLLYKLTENMFCAGYERGGRDACLGDSGGPLMCQEADGHWVLHGVTSNGYGCARANRPGVYTKVKAYLSWVQRTISMPTRNRPAPRCSGHRCPLGECLPPARLCNGYTECSDSSDEALCWGCSDGLNNLYTHSKKLFHIRESQKQGTPNIELDAYFFSACFIS